MSKFQIKSETMDHLDHEEDDMAADAAIQENNNLPVEDSLEEMSEDMMDGTDSEKPLLKFRSDIFKDGVLDGTFTTGDVMEGLNTSTNLCRSNIELAIEMATSSDSDSGFLECSDSGSLEKRSSPMEDTSESGLPDHIQTSESTQAASQGGPKEEEKPQQYLKRKIDEVVERISITIENDQYLSQRIEDNQNKILEIERTSKGEIARLKEQIAADRLEIEKIVNEKKIKTEFEDNKKFSRELQEAIVKRQRISAPGPSPRSNKVETSERPKKVLNVYGFCELCQVKAFNKRNWEQHLGGRKHQENVFRSGGEIGGTGKFCQLCQVFAIDKKNWEKHLGGKRHQENVLRSEGGTGGTDLRHWLTGRKSEI